MILDICLFLADFLISGSVHKVIKFALVRQLHLHNPVFESILVDKLRLILKSLVHLNNSTRYRRDKVACSLDTFNSTEVFACLDLVAVVLALAAEILTPPPP